MSEPGDRFWRRAIALMRHCDCWDDDQELCRGPRPCVCLGVAREEIAKFLMRVRGLKVVTKRNKK